MSPAEALRFIFPLFGGRGRSSFETVLLTNFGWPFGSFSSPRGQLSFTFYALWKTHFDSPSPCMTDRTTTARSFLASFFVSVAGYAPPSLAGLFFSLSFGESCSPGVGSVLLPGQKFFSSFFFFWNRKPELGYSPSPKVWMRSSSLPPLPSHIHISPPFFSKL